MNVAELEQIISTAADSYYNHGSNIISDKEFDGYVAQLRSLDPNNDLLKKVGAEPTLDKMDHAYPMGSLDNIDASKENELRAYYDNVANIYVNQFDGHYNMASFHLSDKIDGSSIALYYNDGVLVRALTRGNGFVGQDITAKVALFKNVPATIPFRGSVVIRGEAVMLRQDFNDYIARNGVEGVKNPRNVGNGLIVRKDCKGAGLISFFAFNMLVNGVQQFTVSGVYDKMKSIGFVTPRYVSLTGYDNVKKYVSEFDSTVSDDYDVDGLVIRTEDLRVAAAYNHGGDELRLRSERAIKFNSRRAETRVTGVNITIGHSGKLTPTLTVEPVDMGGVIVSNVLIYNFEEPKRLGVAIGDKVQIVLAGDVIPKVARLVEVGDYRTHITVPNYCPYCSSTIVKKDLIKGESLDYYCSNSSACSGVKLVKLKNFIGSSKRGMGILNLGDQLIDHLFKTELVTDFTDFYILATDDLVNLPLGNGIVGLKRATTIYDNIQASKSNSIVTVLASVGIETLGTSRAELMIKLSGDKLLTISDWVNGKDVIMSLEHEHLPKSHLELIVSQIYALREQLLKLESMGVGVPVTIVESSGPLPFEGISFCFTGTRELVDEVEKLGGKIASGVSKNVKYLVQKSKDSTSSKSSKAKELGVEVIGIEELKQLISNVKPA